jgi:predicted PurR-regulated permease PerM
MASSAWVRALGTAAVLVPLALILYAARGSLPPFLIAFAVAVLLDPLLDRLEARGWSRLAAVLFVYAFFLLAFLAIALVLIPTAVTQAQDLIENYGLYQKRLEAWGSDMIVQAQPLLRRFNLPTTTDELITQYRGQINASLQVLVARITSALQGALGKALWLVIIPIVTFYLMLDIDRILVRLIFLFPEGRRERVAGVGRKVVGVFTGYLRGLFVVCAAYAIVNGLILFLLFHLQYSLVIGLLAGILYAVPYIGAIATIALGTLVALATPGHSAGFVVGVAVTLLATNQVFDQVVTPRVVGGQVGLHPVLSLFALIVGGDLFGLAGMLLAVPLAASIQVILLELFPALSRPLPGYRGDRVRAPLGRGKKAGAAPEETPEDKMA